MRFAAKKGDDEDGDEDGVGETVAIDNGNGGNPTLEPSQTADAAVTAKPSV
jgi:hypothetical protein